MPADTVVIVKDLLLDSPRDPSGAPVVSPELAAEIELHAHGVLAAAERMATDRGAHALISLGNLFDTGFVTRATVGALVDLAGRLPCELVIVPGEFDPPGGRSPYNPDWVRAAGLPGLHRAARILRDPDSLMELDKLGAHPLDPPPHRWSLRLPRLGWIGSGAPPEWADTGEFDDLLADGNFEVSSSGKRPAAVDGALPRGDGLAARILRSHLDALGDDESAATVRRLIGGLCHGDSQ